MTRGRDYARSERVRRPIELTLPAECHDRLVELAAKLDCSRSKVVERMVLEWEPSDGKYRGYYLEIMHDTGTREGRTLTEGSVVLAIGDVQKDGWIRVLAEGGRDHVRETAVTRMGGER